MEGRFKREGTYVYLWPIHVDVWQKPMKYCKAIMLQLRISKGMEMVYRRQNFKRNMKRMYAFVYMYLQGSRVVQHNTVNQPFFNNKVKMKEREMEP